MAVAEKGYGAALIGGIEAAQGRFVVMGDADGSYDFSKLDGFLFNLRQGYPLVMGNRFAGGIEKGAMPWKNKYLGNPVLSLLGRLLFRVPIKDFHCGLRGFDRQAMLRLSLESPGMEFASEMIIKAKRAGYRMKEVPTVLRKDGRGRPPHLNPWRDGWRHLKLLLASAPKMLFTLPGQFLSVLGIIAGMALLLHPLEFAKIA